MSIPALDVLVVGAGPVGLTAAGELARHGVTTRIIDKLAEPTAESRAIVVHARTLEIMARVGLVEKFHQAGNPARAMQLRHGDREVATIRFGDSDAAYPYSLMIPQPDTERILREHLAELGVRVDRGVELVGLTQRPDRVVATLRHADGAEENLETKWLIGADGGHSTVRDLAGTRLEGVFKGERFILADLDARHDLEPDFLYTWLSADGPTLAFPMRGERVRIIAQIPFVEGSPPEESPSLSEVQRILDERVGGIQATDARWTTVFEIHHAQAPDYRIGRVFLAGDAAHIHGPAGGQGMNTGIQDAHNLAWKLAIAVHGDESIPLLDSYQAERHPVAKRVLDLSTGLTEVGVARDSVWTDLRDPALRLVTGLPAVQHTLANRVEEVSVNYTHSPIVVRSHHLGGPEAGTFAGPVPDKQVQQELDVATRTATGHIVLHLHDLDPISDEIELSDLADFQGPAMSHIRVSTAAFDDSTVSDPGDVIRAHYGLPHGGHVIIRPDGYLGAILEPGQAIDHYFTLLR